ncbi:MAG: hypothetical protein QXQ46_10385 [Thermoplasmatales archaeon]
MVVENTSFIFKINGVILTNVSYGDVFKNAGWYPFSLFDINGGEVASPKMLGLFITQPYAINVLE